MKNFFYLLISFFMLIILFIQPTYSADPTVNNDVVVTSYKTVVMEQGKSKVFPLFKIRNNGSQTYTDIKLMYYEPKGLSGSGKNVSIRRSNNEWATVTLKPGQEVTLNPSRKNYTYLSASTDQALTMYSTEYYFYFKDQGGHTYTTPKRRIEDFVKVIPFNNDVVVTGYQSVVMEQGKSKVFPLFKIRNNGSQTYTDIKLMYYEPKGLSGSGKNVSIRRSNNEWATVTLKPGQEVTFNPSRKNYTYLSTSTDQALTMYSTEYYFYFKDQGGHTYTTPKRRIEDFVKIIPFNNDVVVTSYKSVVMEQGKSKVFPLFKIRNNGSQIYTDIKLMYYEPKGLSGSGKNVSIRRSNNEWATVTLKPGQEVTFNPSRKNYTYLSASTDQALAMYSTDYYFYFKDQGGHTYTTPRFTINDFVHIVAAGNSGNIKEYRQNAQSYRKKSASDPNGGSQQANLLEIRNMLTTQIANLENIVHPKHLVGLKEILNKLNKNLIHSPTKEKQQIENSVKTSNETQEQFQEDAVQYGLDMMNPLKSSKDVQKSFDRFKKSAEKALSN